jgi:hypothetical protein
VELEAEEVQKRRERNCGGRKRRFYEHNLGGQQYAPTVKDTSLGSCAYSYRARTLREVAEVDYSEEI